MTRETINAIKKIINIAKQYNMRLEIVEYNVMGEAPDIYHVNPKHNVSVCKDRGDIIVCDGNTTIYVTPAELFHSITLVPLDE